mgnify:FL=1
MSLARLSSSLLLTILLGSIAQVNAYEANSFEITPLIGYRFGGDFEANDEVSTTSKIKLSEEINYGLLFAWDFDRKRQGEFLINHYNSQFSQAVDPIASNNNIAITYAHIGGNVPISDGYLPVYITGGLGLTHLSPEDSLLDDETRFSMNIGIATKIPVSEHLSFRLGGRVYATFFNSDSTIFCNEETCAISISSDLWIQSEVNAGLTFTF